MAHAQPRRRTQYATGIIDLTHGRPARLLDVLPGRTGKVYADWIAEREQPWRDAITVAALDPFRGYATAVCTQLPAATRVLDAFHVVALAVRVVDDVRRRVQQDTRGHRGLKDDPLYRVRRLLRLGAERLTRQVTDAGRGPQLGAPKTQAGGRIVPMDQATVQVLTRRGDAQAKERVAWGQALSDSDLVFTRENGEMLRPDGVTRHFGKLVRRAGVPRIRLHDLRHTHASLARRRRSQGCQQPSGSLDDGYHGRPIHACHPRAGTPGS